MGNKNRRSEKNSAPDAKKSPSSRKRQIAKTVETLVTSLIIALLAKQFVIQAFRIPSGSMEDTLLVGDFLFVNKLLYGPQIPFINTRLPAIREPERGDIIVFRAPHVDKDFIKRCVAVEGDTMRYVNNILYVNGERIDEPYKCVKRNPVAPYGYHKDFPDTRQWTSLPNSLRYRNTDGIHYIVPKDHIFMMGDNRNNSEDSRFWGPLSVDRIKGKALVIYMSVNWPGKRLRLSRVGRIIE